MNGFVRLCAVLLIAVSAFGHEPCIDQNAVLANINWQLNCFTVLPELPGPGLGCNLFGSFCPVTCGLCDSYGQPTCSEEEIYHNKEALSGFLRDLGVCPDCAPPPMGSPTVYHVHPPQLPFMPAITGGYTSNVEGDPCSLSGVTCDRCGAAISVVEGMYPTAIPGVVSSKLFELRSLQILMVQNDGAVPDAPLDAGGYANLTNFTSLVLTKMGSGEFPQVKDLRDITTVRIAGNRFTGDINNALGAPKTVLVNVEQENGDWTSQHTVSFPMSADLCRMSQMQEFMITGPFFHGEIPSCMDSLTKAWTVRFRQVPMSGPIDPLTHSTALRQLELTDGHFTGTLPLWVSEITGLETLVLRNNNLTGAIPPLNSAVLSSLDLSSNSFTSASVLAGSKLSANFAMNAIASFPPEWYTLQGVRVLDISHNQISSWPAAGVYTRGTITESGSSGRCFEPPLDEDFNWPHMEVVRLSGNPLHGQDVRSVLGSMAQQERITTVELEGCGLAMNLPNEGFELLPWRDSQRCSTLQVSGFPALVTLNLANNAITSIDERPWEGLQQVDLSNNKLTYVHPLWFSMGPIQQKFTGNPELRLDVAPPDETDGCTATGSDLRADPGAYSQALATRPESSECTSLCISTRIVFVDSTVRSESLCRCRAGYFGQGHDCTICPANTFATVGSLNVTQCPSKSSTLGLDGSQSVDACECDPGYYREYLEDSFRCTECPAHHIRVAPGARAIADCVPCPSGEYADPGSTSCLACPAGSIAAGGGAGAGCFECGPGTYLPAASTSNSSTLVQECLQCPRGKYQPESGQGACLDCAAGLDTWSSELASSGTFDNIVGAASEENCGCQAGTRPVNGNRKECIACGSGEWEGLECPGGLTDEVVTLLPGYWSDVDLSIYKCWDDKDGVRCPGGRRPGQVCDPDRDGVTCSLCAEGKVLTVDDECVECSPVSYTAASLAFTCVVAGCIALYMFNERRESSNAVDSSRAITLTIVLTFGFVQQVGVLSLMPIDWDKPADLIMKTSRTANFNPKLVHFGCMSSQLTPIEDYSARLLLPVGILILLCLVHAVYSIFAKKRKRSSYGKITLFCAMGMVGTLFYITIITLVLTPIQCEQHPNGKFTSKEHGSLLCFEGEVWTSMVALAAVAIIAPMGFMALIFWAVYAYPSKVMLADWRFIRTFDFLFNRYKPKCYRQILLHVFRSFSLALVTVMPTPVFVACTLVFVQALCLGITAHTLPYRVQIASFLEMLFTFSTVLLVCAAVNFAPAETTTDRRAAVMIVIVALLLAVMAIPFVLTYAVYLKLLSLRARFQHFICHDQAASGAFARLLKLALQSKGRKAGLDSEALHGFAGCLNKVRENTDTLVVLCSHNVLFSPWCFGQICIANNLKIPMRLVQLSDYWRPSEACIDSFFEFARCGPLVEMSLTEKHIMAALCTVAGLEAIQMPLLLTEGVLDKLSLAVRSTDWSQSVKQDISADEEKVVDTPSHCLICADHANMEATATAITLKQMLAKSMQRGGDTVVVAPRHHVAVSTPKVVVLLSAECLQSQVFVETLVGITKYTTHAVPIFGQGSFRIPTREEVCACEFTWSTWTHTNVKGSLLSNYLLEMFKEVSISFDAQCSSDALLLMVLPKIAKAVKDSDAAVKVRVLTANSDARPSKQTASSQMARVARQTAEGEAEWSVADEPPVPTEPAAPSPPVPKDEKASSSSTTETSTSTNGPERGFAITSV